MDERNGLYILFQLSPFIQFQTKKGKMSGIYNINSFIISSLDFMSLI